MTVDLRKQNFVVVVPMKSQRLSSLKETVAAVESVGMIRKLNSEEVAKTQILIVAVAVVAGVAVVAPEKN